MTEISFLFRNGDGRNVLVIIDEKAEPLVELAREQDDRQSTHYETGGRGRGYKLDLAISLLAEDAIREALKMQQA